MSINIQNYRSLVSGEAPEGLLPGQVAFNLADMVQFVGYGGDVNYDVNGDPVLPPPAAGEGWKAYSLSGGGGGSGTVTSVTALSPLTVLNGTTTPQISVGAASTTASGVVQLNDTTNSTSTTQALTANAGSVLQQQINALAVSSNITLAGTIDASTGFMVTVTTEGAANGFAVGSPLPAPAAGNDDYFAIVTNAGTMTPPGGSAQICHVGDWWLSNGTVWQFLDVAAPIPTVPQATPTSPGTVLGKTSNAAATTALGYQALNSLTSGVGNVGIGWNSGSSVTSGNSNVSVGSESLPNVTSGSLNTALGEHSGFALNTGSFNVFLGHYTGCTLTTGCRNLFFGGGSGQTLASGSDNVFIGDSSGQITSGCANVAIGPNVQLASATGSCQLAIGFASGSYWITGDSTRAIKPGAGIIDCAGSTGTAGQVLMSNGANAVCWGTGGGGGGASPATITTQGTVYGATPDDFVSNTALGYQAGASATGNRSIFIGPFVTGTQVGAGSQNIVIGSDTCLRFPGTDCQMVVGNPTGTGLYFMRGWPVLGCGAVQFQSAIVDTAGNGPNTGQILQAVAGCGMRWCNFPGIQSSAYTAKGTILAASAASSPTALAVGTNGQVLTADSACITGLKWAAVPAPTASAATPSVLGSVYGCTTTNTAGCNTALGFQAALDLTTGTENIAIGFTAGRDISTGGGNIAIGSRSLCQCLNQAITGSNNIAIGVFTLNTVTSTSHNIAMGTGSLAGTSGGCNIGIGGFVAQAMGNASCNVAMGQSALASNITGNNNIAIGFQAGYLSAPDAACGVINITGSNCITIGNCFHTCATIKVGWTTTSDVRDKAIDPAGVPYGLSFVNQINPIAYRWCDRATGELTEERLRYGFSAQNIRALEAETYQPVIVSADDEEHLMLTDQMLLPVLVNAIKELSMRLEITENELAEMKSVLGQAAG